MTARQKGRTVKHVNFGAPERHLVRAYISSGLSLDEARRHVSAKKRWRAASRARLVFVGYDPIAEEFFARYRVAPDSEPTTALTIQWSPGDPLPSTLLTRLLEAALDGYVNAARYRRRSTREALRRSRLDSAIASVQRIARWAERVDRLDSARRRGVDPLNRIPAVAGNAREALLALREVPR